jgi:hypothetical protein
VVDHRVAARRVHLLGGPRLAGDHVPGDGGPAAGALENHAAEHLGEGVDGLGLEHAADHHRLRLPHRAPLGVLDPSHHDRLHQVAAVRDGGCGHRDLEAGDADLLAEGERR